MVQLYFSENSPYVYSARSRAISGGTMSFVPHNIFGSISLLTVNIPLVIRLSSAVTLSHTLSLGLYSLSGDNLTLLNSLVASSSYGKTTSTNTTISTVFLSATATSATSNLTPGTWFWGLLFNESTSSSGTSGSALISEYFYGGDSIGYFNNFPVFIGGRMSASTSSLPASYATSDLDTAGSDAMQNPYLILSG